MKLKLEPKWIKAAVYGANDGIITTFAVVSGVAGAQLSASIVLILGIANMVADGVSMGVGDYLGEKSEHRVRKIQNKKYQTPERLWLTGLITFVAFVMAGSLPLTPYLVGMFDLNFDPSWQFPASIMATGLTLFSVGSARTIVTKGHWFRNGLEMLLIGALAAIIAYGLGVYIEKLVR